MEISDFDNRFNYRLESDVPELCKSNPCKLGIDEAGRGPVLGPMVYATSFCPLSDTDTLNSMGFADSKTLTEEQREDLFDKLNKRNDLIGWIVDVLSPNFISNGMLAKVKYNLNQISHDAAAGLIQRALDRGANIREVYVDTVGDPNSYKAKLQSQFPNLSITVAKKADSTYPIVSAASICAKVARDKVVKEWKFIEGEVCGESADQRTEEEGKSDAGYGSGYPGDPKTKKFLQDALDPVFGYPQFVRFGWSTASNLIDAKCISVHWEDDDEDDNEKSGGKRKNDDIKSVPVISSFFQTKNKTTSEAQVTHPMSHRFFTERSLKSSATLQLIS